MRLYVRGRGRIWGDLKAEQGPPERQLSVCINLVSAISQRDLQRLYCSEEAGILGGPIRPKSSTTII